MRLMFEVPASTIMCELRYNEFFTMHAILIAMSKAKREMQECEKAWEGEVRVWESARERGRVKSKNTISVATAIANVFEKINIP